MEDFFSKDFNHLLVEFMNAKWRTINEMTLAVGNLHVENSRLYDVSIAWFYRRVLFLWR